MPRVPLRIRITHATRAFFQRVGDACYAVIRPIDQLFRYMGGWILGVTDSFEAIETVVARSVGWLFRPLLQLAAIVGRALNRAFGPLGFLGNRFGRSIQAFGLKLNLEAPLRWARWITFPIWRPVAGVVGFVLAWVRTRRPRELALAAPAVALTLPFAWVAVQGASLSRNTIAERYKLAVRDSVESGDFESANLYERKLAQMGIDTRKRDYINAITLAAAGNFPMAFERMQRLAPATEPGYAPAHAWLLSNLVSDDPDWGSVADQAGREERLALAQQHVDRLAEMKINPEYLARTQAFLYANEGRLRDAVDQLAPYANDDFIAASMSLSLLTQLRAFEEALAPARFVLDTAPMQDDSTQRYEAWALAAELLDEAAALESALRAWIAAEPELERPRKLLAKHRRERTVRLLTSRAASPRATVETLCEAVRLGSPDVWTLEQAAQLQSGRGTNAHHQKVWDYLVQSDETPAALLSIMGNVAAGAGLFAESLPLYERALAADPDNPVVLNNVAWILTQGERPDPDRALALVGRALEIRPADHRFRETRGQVMIVLGRWDEAIADLEFALNGMPEEASIHASLALAYEALSRPGLAKFHRRQASL